MGLETLKSPTILHNAIVAPADKVFRVADYRNTGSPNNRLNLELSGTCSTFSMQPRASLDGTVWFNLGSAITAKGLSTLDFSVPYLSFNVTAVSGGNLTVRIG